MSEMPRLFPGQTTLFSPAGEQQEPELPRLSPSVKPPQILEAEAAKNLHLTRGEKAASVAQDLAVANQLGVDPGLVGRNRDELYSRADTEAAIATLADAPALSEFMAQDRINTILAKDELGLLASLEREFKSGLDRMSVSYDVGNLYAEELIQLRYAQNMGDESPETQARVDAVKAKIKAIQPAEPNNLWERFMGVLGQQTPIQEEIIGSSVQGALEGALVGGTVGAVGGGPLAPVGASAGAAVGAGAGAVARTVETSFRLETGSAFDEFLDSGMDKETARWASRTYGALASAIETITVPVKAIPGVGQLSQAATSVPKAALRNTIKGAVLRFLGGATKMQVGEAAEEVLQTITQDVIKSAGQMFDGTVVTGSVEETLDNAFNAAIDSLLYPLGAGMQTPRLTVDLYRVRAQRLFEEQAAARTRITGLLNGQLEAAQVDEDMLRLDTLRQAATQSTLRQADPARFEQLIAAQVETSKTNITEVFISGEAFAAAVQSVSPEEVGPLFQALGLTMDTVNEAVATGADVTVAMSKYMAHMAGTQLDTALVNDIRTRANGMTVNEREAWLAESQDELAKLADEAKTARERNQILDTEAAQIEEAIINEIDMTTSVATKAVAPQLATIWSSFFTTLASRGFLDTSHEGSAWKAFRTVWPDVRSDTWQNFQRQKEAGQPIVDQQTPGRERQVGDFTVNTEDAGVISARVIRSENGDVSIFTDKSTTTYNAEFAGGKTDEEIISYAFEPLGVIGVSATPIVDLQTLQQDAAYAGVENQAEVEEAARLWAEMGTESPYFKRWSGGAPVVLKNAAPSFATGQAVVVEADHGSPDIRFVQEDGIFKSEKERYGFGRSEAAHWFTRDTATAKTYADPRRAFDYQNAEPGVVSAYVRLDNPFVVNAAGQNWRDAQKRGKTSDVIAEARANGHDGVIIYNVKDDYNNDKKTRPTTTLTVFSSTQIKSVNNRGTFDPADPKILNQAQFAGATTSAEIEEARRLWAEMGTESPYFKRWADGRQVFKAFHGTISDVEAFDPSKSGTKSKTGAPEGTFFFTDKADVASSYTVERNTDFMYKYFDGANVMPVYVAFRKPLRVNAKGDNWRSIFYKGEEYDVNELAAMAKSSGKYDGLVVSRISDKGVGDVESKTATTYIAFDPTQIKSVNNRGTFDPADARILNQSLSPETQAMADRIAQALNQQVGPEPDAEVAVSPTLYQVQNLPEWSAKTRAWMEKNGYTAKEIEKHLGAIEGQMRIFAALGPMELEMLPKGAGLAKRYTKDGVPYEGPLRENVDPIYKITFDASAMCVKRLEAAATANYVQAKIGRALTTSERMALVALFRSAGKAAPCIYYYVEAPRAKSGEFVKTATDVVFGVQDTPKHTSGKKKGQEKWSAATLSKARAAQEEAKALGLSPSDVDPNVLLDPEYAQTEEAKAKEAAAPAIYKFLRSQQLNAKSNLPKLYEEYDGQILGLPQELLDELNVYAGLRFFSSSDFQAEHVADLMQAVFDMEIRQAKAHAYTKVPDFVRIFGGTGIKIQTSIFAKEVNGEIVMDDWQGMNWDDAKAFREQYDNVGTVLVATSDAIVLWAKQQDWIDYIIPFHWSGLEKKFYTSMDWQDFTSTQTEQPLVDGATIKKISMHETGSAAGISNEQGTRNYLTLALERGIVPVFPAFLFKDFQPSGDRAADAKNAKARWELMAKSGEIDWDMIDPEYYKLRKDYARTDTPFSPVQSNIDVDMAEKILGTFLDGTAPKAKVDTAIADRLIGMIRESETTGADIGVEALKKVNEGQTLFQRVMPVDNTASDGIVKEKEVVYEKADRGEDSVSARGGEGVYSEERGVRPLPGARLVELRSTEKRSVPATVVSPRHAAAAMSFLSDAPQEQLSALVLDKNGKPLAILSHSLGNIDSTQVDNRALLGAIQDVAGAKSFYLVHNHPAETAVLSSADRGLSENIRIINEGSGLSYGGIIAVTPSGYGDEFGDNQSYPPLGKQKKVPVVQRMFVKADRVQGLGPVSSPEDIKSNISTITGGAESGIILLSNNNVPIGFLPLDPAEMSRLRGDRLGEVLKSFHRTNATGIVGILPNEASLSAWRNVAAMANAIKARPLDALFRNGAGSLDSARMQGKDVDSYGSKTFYQAAYHGSPHRFSKFSLEHMGSGEGAQAYGWGLYFAGKKEVAEYYRQELSKRRYGVGVLAENGDAVLLTKLREARDKFSAQLERGKTGRWVYEDENGRRRFFDTEDEAKSVNDGFGVVYEDRVVTDSDMDAYRLEQEIGAILSGVIDPVEAFFTRFGNKKEDVEYAAKRYGFDTGGILAEKEGQLYKVDIPEDDVMLHWDRPLSEQPEKVRDGIENIRKYIAADWLEDTLDSLNADFEELTGAELYRMLGKAMQDDAIPLNPGEDVERALEEGDGKKAASLLLNSEEIKGIKYLDGSSRSQGEGSYNYVIFDDATIDILETFYQQQQDQANAAVDLTAGPSGTPIVTLFETANESSFLHESGHIFVRFIQQIAQQPGASQELKDLWSAIAKEIGHEGRGPIQVEAHEKFARALEVYFAEGKAPSKEMIPVFAAFATWLKRLYTTLFMKGHKPSPELAALFDRLFATDDQIAEREAAHEAARPFFVSAEAMLEAEREAYGKLRKRAEETARDKALRQMTKAYVTALGGKKQFTADAKAEADKLPVYRAADFIAANGGLNIQDVDNLVGEETRKALGKKLRVGSLTKSGKLDPDQVAKDHGYQNAEAMLQALLDAEPKGQYVKRVSDEKMAEKREVLERGMADDAAEEHYHSDERLAVLIAETEMLRASQARAAGQTARKAKAIELAAVREVAREVIKQKTVSKASSYKSFLRAELAASKKARRAMEAGDKVEAEKWKRQEMLNHALVLEAIDARERVEKGKARLERQRKNGKADEDVRDMLTDIAIRFGLVTRPPKVSLADSVAAYNKWLNEKGADGKPRKVIDFGAWAAEQESKGYGTQISPLVSDRSQMADYRDLTLAEFEDILGSANHIATIESRERTIKVGDKWVEVEEVVNALIAQMQMTRDAKQRSQFNPKWYMKFLEADASLEKMELLFKSLDGGTLGPFYEYFMDRVNKAKEREDDMMLKAANDLTGMMAKHYTFSERQALFGKRIMVKEIGESITRAQLLRVLLDFGNEGNYMRRRDGNGWTDAQMEALKAYADKRDWDYIQEVWNYLDTYRPEAFQVHKDLTGATPEQIMPREVQTPYGVYAGGYFPSVIDKKYNTTAQARQQIENAMLYGTPNFAHAMTKHGHTKARMQSAGGQALSIELSDLTDHVFGVIHDITHRAAVMDVAKIIRHKDFNREAIAYMGKEVYDQLTPWIKDIANSPIEPATFPEKAFRAVRMGTTVARLAKIGVGLQQIAGLTQSVAQLKGDSGKLLKVLGTYMINPKRMLTDIAFANESSAFMRHRITSTTREAADTFRGLTLQGKVMAEPGRMMMRFMGACQKFGTDVPTWRAAYDAELSRRSNENMAAIDAHKRAVEYADHIVRISQGSGDIKDLTQTQRSKSEMVKAITMFYSFLASAYAQMVHPLRGKKVHLAHFMLTTTMLAIIGPSLAEILSGRPPEDEDEDGEVDWDIWVAKNSLKFGLSLVPGVKDVLGSAASGFGYNMTPIESPIRDLVWLLRNTPDVMANEEYEKLLKPGANVFGVLFKFPSDQVLITGTAAYKLLQDDPDYGYLDLIYKRRKE